MPLVLVRTECGRVEQAPVGVRHHPTLTGRLLVHARSRCNRPFHAQVTRLSEPIRPSSDKPIVLSENLVLPAQHD
jgi:hypothetical protein